MEPKIILIFLFFTSKYIISLEVKTSTEGGIKPMWNSHLPQANGLYVFASFGKRDITFFHGADVIDPQLNKDYANVWKDIQALAGLEIVRLKKEGKEIRPIALYERVVFDLPVKEIHASPVVRERPVLLAK